MEKIYFSELNYKLLTNWKDIRRSKFDITFENVWKEKMKKGVFRYELNALRSKNLGGNSQFFAQLNIDRATNRRLPQHFHTITQPFDEKAFNFTKINKNELMFQVIYNEHGTECKKTENYIAVNVSPMEFGHSLLLPALFGCLPQLLTLSSIEFSVYTLLCCHNPSFRISFNSLCAYATVNHLHLHGYYLSQPMLLETCVVDHLSGSCYVLENFPSKGYVFQIKSVEAIVPIIRDVYRLTSFLIQNDTAHNLYMTRGLCFERNEDPIQTTERDCIRIYVWARTHSPEIKILDEFNPAACELFGHLLIKTEESYNRLSEEHVAEVLNNLTEGPYKATKEKVRLLFQNNDQ